jgi:uncharacterized protein DUF397
MPARELDVITWRKSSYSSGEGECVEIGWPDDAVAVRDSKNPGGPILTVSTRAWTVFLQSRTG